MDVGFSLRDGGYSFLRRRGWGRSPGCWGHEVKWPRGESGLAEVNERLAGGARLLQGEWPAIWLGMPDGKIGPRLVGWSRAVGGLEGKGFLRQVPGGQWFSGETCLKGPQVLQ